MSWRSSKLTVNDDFRVTLLLNQDRATHLNDAFAPMKTNLLAIQDEWAFLALEDRINVYRLPDFSARVTPLASEIFPSTPLLTLGLTTAQLERYRELMEQEDMSEERFEFNHIRAGYLGEKRVIVGVGEWGVIALWNIDDLIKQIVDKQIVTKQIVTKLTPHKLFYSSWPESTWGLAFNRESNLLFVSSNSHSISAFDAETQEHLYLSPPGIHTHNIPSLDSQGPWLISAGIDQRSVLWNFSDPQKPAICPRRIKIDEWGWLARFVDVQPPMRAEKEKPFKLKKEYFDVLEGTHDCNELQYMDLDGPVLPYIMSDSDDYEDGEQDVELLFDSSEHSSDEEEENDILAQEAVIENIIRATWPLNRNDDGPFLVEGAENGWPSDDDDLTDFEDGEEEIPFDDHDENEIPFDEEFDDEDEEDDEEFDDDICPSCRNEESLSNDSNEQSLSNDSNEETLSTDSNFEFSDSSESTSGRPFPEVPSYYCVDCEKPHIPIAMMPVFFESEFIPSDAPPHVYLSTQSIVHFGSDGESYVCPRPLPEYSRLCNQHHMSYPFLNARLSMGEWIKELQLLVVADQGGYLFVVDLLTETAIHLLEPPSTGLNAGMAVRVVRDCELGAKAHVFLVSTTGRVSVYEVCRLK